MHPLLCLIAAGMLAASALPAHAATVAYGEAFDTLYRIDLATRQASTVGVAGSHAGQRIVNISGLSTTADGTLYAVAGGLKLLLAIDPADGAARPIGRLGLTGTGTGQYDALDLNMTAGCDDSLWLSSAVARQLWRVDRATGEATPVGPTGHTITGLAARGDRLYGAGGKGDNRFYRLDRASGAATPIGGFGGALATRWVNSVAMSFDADGTLWAVISYVPPQHDSDVPAPWNDLATIDPATGAVTIRGPITGPDALREIGMKGFTLGPPPCARDPGGGPSPPHAAPVDAPWALGLLAALLALAAAAGRRRAPPRAR